MRTLAATALSIATFSCIAVAQSTSLVSPATLATTEGNSNNTFPFYRPFHYMQIHGDLRGKVMVMKGLSFRRDGNLSSNYAGRTIEIEVWFGNSDLSKISNTYASNFTGTKTNVVKKAQFNAPAWPKPPSKPAAFNFNIPFNNGLFIYTGANDLAWEWVTHSTTATGTYPADAHAQYGTLNGRSTRTGTGCIATGQTRAMNLYGYFTTYRGPDRVRFYNYCYYGVATAAGAFLVGPTNPNLPFPVCGPQRLYTDASLAIPATANASGYMTTGTSITIPWNAAFVGASLYSQAYTADANKGPLPVSVSNGLQTIVPALAPLPGAYARIYSYNAPGATTGTIGKGYAVVTRFDG